MKNRDTILLAAAVLFVGIFLGAAAYELGVDYACPSKTCVNAAEITPVTDRGYFDAAHKMLSGAKSTIHVIAFEIKYYPKYANSQENQLVQDLIDAKERGVEVKVLADEFSEADNAYEYLRSKGVDIIYDDNETTTHTKLMIVDGKTILIGSTNLSFFALERNHEANILLTDAKTAGYFERYFKDLWEKQTGRG